MSSDIGDYLLSVYQELRPSKIEKLPTNSHLHLVRVIDKFMSNNLLSIQEIVAFEIRAIAAIAHEISKELPTFSYFGDQTIIAPRVSARSGTVESITHLRLP